MEAQEIVYPRAKNKNLQDLAFFDTGKNLIEEFMKLLDQKIHEAKDMLLERFEYICAQPAESAKFMYENGLMAGYDGKTTRSALCHGTLALG